MLGLSQEKLGRALGLTFQQVQKYERGANRIGASRLSEIAQVLEVPVGFFFDDVDPVRAPAIAEGSAEHAPMAAAGDVLRQPETIELVTAYYNISDTKLRRLFFELAKALSEPGGKSAVFPATPARRAGTRVRRMSKASPTEPNPAPVGKGGSE
jgi:transcriptional regulator with XRE-family HTH domain